MEDDLEDRLIYQTYLSQINLLSNVPNPASYLWKMVRVYCFRSEVVLFFVAITIVVMFLQSIELWSRTLISRFSHKLNPLNGVQKMRLSDSCDDDQLCWQLRGSHSAVYAIKGRRMHMEDRFIVEEDIHNTGVSLFAIFDGHGGQFAANFARHHLTQNLLNKILELNLIKSGNVSMPVDPKDPSPELKDAPKVEHERKKSFKKLASTADDCGKTNITDPQLLAQMNKARILTRNVQPCLKKNKAHPIPLTSYVDKGQINYAKLLTDEVLSADERLVAAAKQTFDVAGTTALLAILCENKLIVANVGDSRGVMCDLRGNAIPVSFDHKPQQVREQKRIEAAGGYIAFNGVWRVAGILATSRAMGDYPLKDKKFVISDPDILTFDLNDHKPMFVILASDGLWDTFTNEEAVKFVKERFSEPDYGAKSLTLQSYFRGSVDNITVLIINFSEMRFTTASISNDT